MPKLEKNLPDTPIENCPLCLAKDFEIIRGSKVLVFKKPDSIRCSQCSSEFNLDNLLKSAKFTQVASPYGFFENQFNDWITIEKCTNLAVLIRENSPIAIDYLSGASRYMWRLRILTDSKGEAKPGIVAINMAWDDPESKKQANKQLAEIRQLQKEIRQVKREMALDMKEIRAKYGRKKENQAAKQAALSPYERTALAIDQLLLGLDKQKLNIQTIVEEQQLT